jgi:CRISPR/Cas system-associated exonuclease Cas4 (RecB family)
MNLIDVYAKSLRAKNPHEFSFCHYPSSASAVIDGKVEGGPSGCLRSQYYTWTGEQETNPSDDTGLMVMNMGVLIQDSFFNALKKEGIEVATETARKEKVAGLENPVSFRTDGELVDQELGKMVVEVKTSYGRFFKPGVEEVKIEHKMQLQCYLNILGVEWGKIVYFDRGNFFRFEKLIQRDAVMFSQVVERWKMLENFVHEKITPPEDFEPAQWQCQYCNFRSKCRPECNYEQVKVDAKAEAKKTKKEKK